MHNNAQCIVSDIYSFVPISITTTGNLFNRFRKFSHLPASETPDKQHIFLYYKYTKCCLKYTYLKFKFSWSPVLLLFDKSGNPRLN